MTRARISVAIIACVLGAIEARANAQEAQGYAELRSAFSLDAAARHRVISDVALRLRMPKMARFVEQLTVTS